jgi:Family of unknown function (DUF6069)
VSSTAVRAITGVFAAAAALLIWVIAVPVLDVDLSTTNMQGQPMEIGPVPIIVSSIGPALAGWALIALLERFAPSRAKMIWTIIAVAALLISFVPLSQMSAAAAATLGLMHLVVGGVIIVVMRSTSKAPAPSASLPAPAQN